jgi:hypothetical protein
MCLLTKVQCAEIMSLEFLMMSLLGCCAVLASKYFTNILGCLLPPSSGRDLRYYLITAALLVYSTATSTVQMDVVVWCTRSPVRPHVLWLCVVLGDTCLIYKIQVLYKCDSCLSEWHDMTWHYQQIVFLKVLYNLPASVCVWLAYLVPAYSMTGLHMQGSDTSSFYVYVGK